MSVTPPAAAAASPAKRLRKRAYHHGDLRAATIAAALSLIAQRGPRGFNLSDAAKLAGVSVGAPYRHFADKRALLCEIAEEGFTELTRRLTEAAGHADPAQALIEIGAAYVRFALDRPSHFRLMFDPEVHTPGEPDPQSNAGQAYFVLVAAVKRLLGRASRSREETLTAAAWSLVHGLSVFAVDNVFSNMRYVTGTESLVRHSLALLVEGAASKARS